MSVPSSSTIQTFMNLSWEAYRDRGQETLAVWSMHTDFEVDGSSFTLHSADVAALEGKAQDVTDAEGVVDAAIDAHKANLDAIERLCIRLPRVASNMIAADDDLQDDIAKIQGIAMAGSHTVMDRARMVNTLWTSANAKRAALTPPKPAIDLPKPVGSGTFLVADFHAMQVADEALGQAVADARRPLNNKRSALRTLKSRVDRTNKRFYESWAAYWPVGSPEHDALSQITTEGGGSGGGGGGGMPTAPTGVPTDIVMMRDSGEHVAASWVLPEGATGVKVFNGAPGGEQTLIGPFAGTSGVFDVAAGTQVWFAATNAVGDGPQDGPHEVP